MKKNTLIIAAFALMGSICMNAQKKEGAKLTLELEKANVSVSPTLYGLMTEEINYSYEGGLYAQLVRNPSFKDVERSQKRGWGNPKLQKPAFWSLTDSTAANMNIDHSNGINEANNVSLRLNVNESNKTAGIQNEGFWGFPIRPITTYKGGIYIKAETKNNCIITISLVSLDGKETYASTSITDISNSWKKYEYSFTTSKKTTPTKDARLIITTNEAGKYWFSRVTLFPPTFNNRKNGLRPDLMTMMKNMKPKFLRFPGGNYLEGNTFSDRFNWKETIGNPDMRIGHNSPWGYRSTDGMGLLEFLEWTEDIGAEPLLAVFAGYVLNHDHIEGEYLKPFIQDALDEIEYVIGGPETKWGAQRVKDGHPAPFNLKYVEIGNEDWFDGSGSYTQRYKQIYDAIKAKYPQLNLISTIGGHTPMGSTMDVPGVKLDIIDEHYYRDATDMYRNAFQYDSYDRKGSKIFCGEWATREGEPTTNMNAALGDAAWMTCMERNSDIVIASCYAPLFVNVSPGGMQWKSDLIGYDALNAYGSPSYYAQVMFSNYLGDKVVPIESDNIPKFVLPMNRRDSMENKKPEKLPELYYVATKDSKTGTIYLKVVNVVDKIQNVTLAFNGNEKIQSKALKVELKSARSEDTNTIDNPKNIVPIKSDIKVKKECNVTFAPYSITVLEIHTK